MPEETPDEGHEESAPSVVCTLLLPTTAHSAHTLTSLNTETGLASCSTGSALSLHVCGSGLTSLSTSVSEFGISEPGCPCWGEE